MDNKDNKQNNILESNQNLLKSMEALSKLNVNTNKESTEGRQKLQDSNEKSRISRDDNKEDNEENVDQDTFSPFKSDVKETFLDKVLTQNFKKKKPLMFEPESMRSSSLSNVDLSDNEQKNSITQKDIKRTSIFNYDTDTKNDEIKKGGLFEHKKFSDFYAKMMENNQNWINQCTLNDAHYFKNMAKPQEPKCLVISCSDSRVVVNDCLGLKPGELFSHRNVGNLVISTDFNVQSVIQFAVQVLKVEHLIVVGHTDCGAVKAALTTKHHGLIDHWLRNIRETAEKYREEIEAIKESYVTNNKDLCNLNHELVRKLIEFNVKEAVLSLCKTPIVQKAWKKGQNLFVHGYVLEIDTGKLVDLDIKQEEWEEIEDTYKFEFDD